MKTDIIIVGGNVSGLTAALVLAKAGFTVSVWEAKAPPMTTQALDTRVFALNHSSLALLQSVNATPSRITPYTHMDVWDKHTAGRFVLKASDVGKSTLGAIVEQSVLLDALITQIQQNPNIEWKTNHPVQAAHVTEKAVHLTSPHGTQEASLLIGADGAASWVRQQFHFPLVQRDYGQQAIVATLIAAEPHQHTAYQCFDESGPLALLPLVNKLSLVWSITSDKAHHWMNAPAHDFEKAISLASEYRLGPLSLDSERFIFPLSMRHVAEYAKARVALVADAAHTFHPLAGQGLNVGLQDIQSLGEVLEAARQQGQDIGALTVLKTYQRARMGRNARTIALMKTFQWGFATPWWPAKMARRLGMGVVGGRKSSRMVYSFLFA
jgi:2-octaprenylphenol hydroxylase